MGRISTALALLLAGAACDGGGGGNDAGADASILMTDAGAPVPPAPPAEPAPPAPPVLTPCPTGWREVVAPSGETVCDPWPEGGPSACSPGEAQFPGEPGCRPVGTACPAGEYPEGLPAGATLVHVRAGATGGDGSAAAPFGTIGGALTIAPEGAVIAIAIGSYDEAVTLENDVTLWGACPAGTIVRSSTAAFSVIAVRSGESATVRNITVGPSEAAGISNGGTLRLERIVIEGALGTGIAARAGTVTGEEVVVRDTRLTTLSDPRATALLVADRATLELRRAVVSGTEGITAHVIGRLRLEDAALLDAPCDRGSGVTVEGPPGTAGARAELLRTTLERICYIGLLAVGRATVTASQVVARDMVVDPVERRCAAFAFGLGARGDLDRAWITGTTAESIAVFPDRDLTEGSGATLTLRDSVIENVAPAPDPNATAAVQSVLSHVEIERLHVDGWAGGAALNCSEPSTMIARDVRLTNGRGIGVRVISVVPGDSFDGERIAISSVEEGIQHVGPVVSHVTDVQIEDVVATMGATGVEVAFGAEVELRRARIERYALHGLSVTQDASLLAEDVTVRTGLGNPDGMRGADGVAIASGGSLVLRRALIEDAGELGIIALREPEGSPAMLEAEDIVVRATRGTGGEWGLGLWAQGTGTSATLTRALFEENRGVSIATMNAALALRDVVIGRTLTRDCATTTCPDQPGGHGLAAYFNPTLRDPVPGAIEASTLIVERSSLCGIQIGGGTASLEDTVTRSNPIGLCIQDGAPPALGGIVFVDNDIDVQTTSFAVPPPPRD